MKQGWLGWMLLGLSWWSSVALAQGERTLRLKTDSPDLPVAESRVTIVRLKLVLTPTADGLVVLPALRDSDTLTVTHPEGATQRLTLSELATHNYQVLISTRSWLLNDVIISANRAPEPALLVPQVVDVATRAELTRRQPLNSADAIEQMGVFVQRSQLGGGSPVIRGFEASRVLLVVDGVRLNNAIYRAGHLQNLITVDPQQLDRVEVVAGPGSALYGSDALGGTIHLTTRGAEYADSSKLNVSGGAGVRTASAANALIGNLALNLGWRRFASRTTITIAQLGDQRAGNIRLPIWGSTGSRTFTQATNPNTGADVLATNPDRNVQTLSGYEQYDLAQKFRFALTARTELGLNAQYSTSSNMNRYDRLTETQGSGLPRFAEWYYGPQARVLVAPYVTFVRTTGAFDQAKVIASFQATSEDRLQRRWAATDLQAQRERVRVWSLNADLSKRIGKHELAYGIEASTQTVTSSATLFRRTTRVVTVRPDLTRYPAGGSTYRSIAAYLSDRYEITRGLWANAGARYQRVGVDMMFVPENNLPFTNSSARYDALVWNASLVWLPVPSVRWAVLGSSGFRTPNVDDLGKFFEAPPGLTAGVLIVPNTILRPERTTNLETTLSYSPRINGGSFTLAATGWYTWFNDALLLRPTRALGGDSVTYNGNRVATYSIQNASRAELWGITGRLAASAGAWSLRANVNYTRGRVTKPTAEPLDHIAPVHGTFSLQYIQRKWNVELYSQWSGWKWAADYRPFGEDNLQYATPNGMPAWAILTLRAELRVTAQVSVQATIENLQDLHYRTFASGISAPGRNAVLGVRYQW